MKTQEIREHFSKKAIACIEKAYDEVPNKKLRQLDRRIINIAFWPKEDWDKRAEAALRFVRAETKSFIKSDVWPRGDVARWIRQNLPPKFVKDINAAYEKVHKTSTSDLDEILLAMYQYSTEENRHQYIHTFSTRVRMDKRYWSYGPI